MLCRASRAATRRPPLLLRGGASTLRRCSSVSSPASDDAAPIPAANTDHVDFIRDVAKIQPPKLLPDLLQVLEERGESIISPGNRKGMVPLAIPLAKSCSGLLLRCYDGLRLHLVWRCQWLRLTSMECTY
ncbi:hypothetical protein BT93_L2651 [Corymbia citriodora subsp. variegata]|uniref:Uncharacterized protein n=1 Tax=Corymbia citriodora subsp. variegata TaxID=360336 RepID=A0A8T0CZX4_CORYI|nr:hypothetical protein BT93_L2651 [Corymbia citriodora subsp. variegata]